MGTRERLFDQETQRHYTGEMAVLDPSGHTRHMWDADDKDQVKVARDLYDSLKKKGYKAFHVTKGGDEGKPMDSFDPEAGKMIMTPPIAGG